jgi:glycogen phosphorylase
MYPGDEDMARAASDLAGRLPDELAPLAHLAYNYRWMWARRGSDPFERIDPSRWMACGRNPVRMLTEASPAALARAAADDDLLADMHALTELVQAETRCPWPSNPTPSEPVAFLCSEFGIHSSLPIYSGGLGILAGDLLKEASDQCVAMVGVGVMYRSGYFHQRIDTSGYQHEYWTDTDPDRLPAARVTASDGQPLRVPIPVFDVQLTATVWRVDVGRVPLYLLDTDGPDNPLFGRWITSRLYDGNRLMRLAQYAVLGVGGARALRAMAITPTVWHLNEGHPALAAWDLLAEQRAAGTTGDVAWDAVRSRFVFTTHTPVAAGN